MSYNLGKNCLVYSSLQISNTYLNSSVNTRRIATGVLA